MSGDLESKGLSEHQDETIKSEASPAPKLDPHGYPLRPQPTDDPKGIKGHSLYKEIDLIVYRSSQLEPMAESMGPLPSRFSRFPRSLHAGCYCESGLRAYMFSVEIVDCM